MENNHFGKLTERMHNFREELLNAKPYVCAERSTYDGKLPNARG